MNRYLQLFFSMLKMVSVPLLNFLTLFLGIKFYGKENWGDFISISIWIFFIAFIAKWSGQNYLLKEFSKNTSNYLNIFYSNVLERSVFLLPSLVLFFVFPFHLALSVLFVLILLFIYNSYEALIVYNQKFQLQFIVEIIGMLLLLIGFIVFPVFNLTTIFYVFGISYLTKCVFLFLNFNHSFKNLRIGFSFIHLKKSFPFFLIGFSGWLASKCDIYIVSVFFSKKELSEYQILISCFLMLQAIPAYLVLPINKHLFRLPQTSINKIKKKLIWFALPIIIMSSTLIWLVMSSLVHIQLSFLIYFIASFSTVPTFFYSVDVLQLYKKNKENEIMKLSFITAFLNSIALVFLVPNFRILGAIISICMAQWLYLFFILKENNK
jgi:O-antigen/teichoic acid export membrane protein